MRLAKRITALTCGSVLAATLVVCGLGMLVIGSRIAQQRKQGLAVEANQAAARLCGALGELTNDVHLLASLPTTRHIAKEYKQSQDTTASTWGKGGGLEEVFCAILSSKPTYDQVRLLAADGQELVRCDRGGGELLRVRASQLQSKADRDYFQHAISTPAGQLSVSPITLNREHGEITTPHAPMLRVALRLDSKSGDPLGVVIINQRFDRLIEALFPERVSAGRLYVINEEGDYLAHPDPSHTFGFDLGTRRLVQHDYPQAAALFDRNADQHEAMLLADDQGNLLQLKRLAIADGKDLPSLTLGLSADSQEWLVEQKYWLGKGAAVVTLLCCVCLLVSLRVAKRQVQPLEQAVEAARTVASGRELPEFTAVFNDEFGDLAQALQQMNDHLVSVRQRDAEQANRTLARLNAELRCQNEQIARDRCLLETIINCVPEALFWKDRDSVYLGCNQFFAEIARLGHAHEIVGLSDFDLPWSREHAEQSRRRDRQVLNGERVSNLEQIFTDAKGDERVIWTSKAPLLGPGGETLGVVGLFSDVTKTKALEQRLAQSQKLEAVGQLAAGVAHEINTPMQFLLANTEFLANATATLLQIANRCLRLGSYDSHAEVRQELETITQDARDCRFDYLCEQIPLATEECCEGVQRISTIVQAMRDFSDLGGAERTLVDVNQVVEKAVTVCGNRWKPFATIDLQLDPCLRSLPAFAAELNQALLNTVSNAADAVAERFGEGELGKITIRTRQQEDAIEIEVQDNGCGMSQEVLAKAYEPFFTTKEVGKGSGQGLVVVRESIVKLHKGWIDLNSTPGVGTLLTITLPTDSNHAGDPAETNALGDAELTTCPESGVHRC